MKNKLVRRWLVWLVTLTIVGIVGALVLPFVRSQPAAVHTYFASAPFWQSSLAIFVACTVLVWGLFRLLSPRITHLKAFRHLPPAWSAFAMASALLCVADLIFGL